MSRQPIVAVTATTEIVRRLPRVQVNEAYTSALAAAGIIPLVVSPLASGFVDIVDRVDGLVLTGGEDVAPARYGAERGPHTDPPHTARDGAEIALVAAARAACLPTLAICRGLQVANVALGGTLIQDIPSERPSALAHSRSDARAQRVHEVNVTDGSRLATALGATTLTVNSSHHQAIDRAAPGLTVTALAPDGIIEGAEWTRPDGWWLLGVQWHPEELMATPERWDWSLFAAFRERLDAMPRRSSR
ncbi:MAG: gamma-glutamyl-gamma-aminobutyrate hydrolase family protein [Gemmatimonadaceae bacterium]